MLNDPLSLPVDAPAGLVWRDLWALGIDAPHPTDSEARAEDWLTSLDPEHLETIYQTALEGTNHE